MTKKILLFLIGAITWILLCVPVFAENFYIENYNVDLVVNKSKQVHVTETIDTYFTTSSHGIYRNIPHKDATVTNIQVYDNFSVTDSFGQTEIKIGDPNIYINGKHRYIISYDYNFFDNKNEFYFNIIGTKWDTPIHHASFNIKMPEAFDPSKVGISIGQYGTVGFDGGAEFSIEGLNITGKTTKMLNPNEGITIRLEVPEGYFYKYQNTKAHMLVCLLCLLTFISFIIWYVFGKDEKAIPIVNFYPPKGMNTLDTEIAYKEKASIQGLVAMLISLAHRGYIKIHDTGTDFKLTKLKPYDGTDKFEQRFMSALFFGSNKFADKYQLEHSTVFYQDCAKIVEDANSKKNNIYEKNSVSWSLRIIMFFCLLGVVLITFGAMINFNLNNIEEIGMPLLSVVIAISVLITGVKKDPWLILWAIMFSGIPLFMLIANLGNVSSYNMPILTIGIVCSVISSICLYHLRKRNKYALRVLGNLLGFKKFIETAESHRLKSLVEKEPEYFYNVLPFAYLFGISDKWINKFEGIMKLQPDWYEGSTFNARSFNHFSRAMNSASIPSTINGGVSTSSGGGGGFSGGGGGGGGGGSW